MTSPTPGPWLVSDDGLVTGLDSRARFAGTPSIDIFDASEWPAELAEEAMANARLIAAAPDLLSALGCIAFAEHVSGGLAHEVRVDYETLKEIRLLLARAEGLTP